MDSVEIAATKNFVILTNGKNSKKWHLQYRLRQPEGRTARRYMACIYAVTGDSRRSCAIDLIDSLIYRLNDLKAKIERTGQR